MNNNGEYASTILYRYFSSGVLKEAKLEEFEQELCDLKSAGYSVEGITLNDGYLLAVLTKKLDSSVQKVEEGKQK